MKYGIRGILVLAIIAIISFLIGFYFLDNAQLSEIFGCDVEHHKIILDGNGGIVEFSLVERYPMMVFGGAILIALFVFLFIRVNSLILFLKKGFRFIVDYFKTTMSMIWKSDVKYLLLISTLAAIYGAYVLPVIFDETLTYYDFVKPSVWYGLAFYPYPNNHVFLSLLLNIVNEIPGIDLLFKLRIVPLLANLLTWILVYRFVRKYYGENVALFVVGLGMVVPITFFYGFLARGYVFVTLFLVLCLYAAYNIVNEGNRRRDWVLFAIGGMLGAYSVPSFLYPFVTVNIFILIYNYRHIKTQILYSALVGLGVLILYLPILIVGGVEALAQNGYVLPILRLDVLHALPGYYKGVAVSLFVLPPYAIAIILALVLGYTLYKREKKTLLLWILFCSAPFVLLLLHAVIPFFRVFNYYGFVLVFLIGISLSDLLKSVNQKILLFGLVVLQILGLTNFYVHKDEILLEASASEEIVDEVLEDNKRYYFHSGIESALVEGNLKFEGERRGYDVDTKLIWMTVLEDAEKGYDYYFVLKAHDRTEKYQPWKEMIGPFEKPINIYNKESLENKKE